MARHETEKTRDELRLEIHFLRAQKLLSLYMLGDELAEREGYELSELDALCYYLFDKRGLDPALTSLLSADALALLLAKEMKGWVRPEGHRQVRRVPHGEPATSYEATLGVLEAQARLDHFTEQFGDHVATREGFSHADGREALEIYLCRKFGYRPHEVRSWSMETIGALLEPEMKTWTPPRGEAIA